MAQLPDGSWRGSVLASLEYPNAGTIYCEDASTGQILAYSVYGVRGSNHFGPIEVNEKLRRSGISIGKVLLLKTLQEIKNAGFDWAEIIWIGPIRFYVKTIDANIGRVFFMFKKDLQ